MTGVVIVEMVIALVAGCTFIALYALRSSWRETQMGRHIMAFTAVTVTEVGSLLALAIWHVPIWVYTIVFAAMDLVIVQRLVLLIRAQRTR